MKKPALERVTRLLEFLTTRGPTAFTVFCNILKELKEYELAYELMRAAYRKEKEVLV